MKVNRPSLDEEILTQYQILLSFDNDDEVEMFIQWLEMKGFDDFERYAEQNEPIN